MGTRNVYVSCTLVAMPNNHDDQNPVTPHLSRAIARIALAAGDCASAIERLRKSDALNADGLAAVTRLESLRRQLAGDCVALRAIAVKLEPELCAACGERAVIELADSTRVCRSCLNRPRR